MQIKLDVIAPLNIAHLFHFIVSTFHHNLWTHPGKVWKLYCGRNQTLASQWLL